MKQTIKQTQLLTQIIEAVTKYNQEDQANNDLYNKVYEALKKHDGQKISKHFANTVEKALGSDYDVYYSTQYGLYKLKIRRKGESSDKYKDFLLGHESNHAYAFLLNSADTSKVEGMKYVGRGFDYHNAWAGYAALERIAKNNKVLKSGKLKKLADLEAKKSELQAQIDKLKLDDSYDFPAFYSVEKVIKLKESES